MSTVPVAWITGASRGLGRALVKQLYASGFDVYFSGRDRNLLDDLGDELNSIRPNTNKWYRVVIDHADLSQFSSLDEVILQLPKLDLLINNAGLIPKQLAVTAQGFEEGFGVNYLSHFFLTEKLWSKLLLSDQARIINVSSLAFGNGVIDFQQPRAWPADGWQAYSNSKLALILFAHSLALRSQSTSITVNSVCPGIVDTNLLKDHPLFPPSMLARLSNAMQSSESASEFLLWMSMAKELDTVSGKFFSRSQGGYQPLSLSINEALAEKLWQCSIEWTQVFLTDLQAGMVTRQMHPWVM